MDLRILLILVENPECLQVFFTKIWKKIAHLSICLKFSSRISTVILVHISPRILPLWFSFQNFPGFFGNIIRNSSRDFFQNVSNGFSRNSNTDLTKICTGIHQRFFLNFSRGSFLNFLEDFLGDYYRDFNRNPSWNSTKTLPIIHPGIISRTAYVESHRDIFLEFLF